MTARKSKAPNKPGPEAGGQHGNNSFACSRTTFRKIKVVVHKSHVHELREFDIIREICGHAPRRSIFRTYDRDDNCCSWRAVYRANRVKVV
jgi:hypothetical protein